MSIEHVTVWQSPGLHHGTVQSRRQMCLVAFRNISTITCVLMQHTPPARCVLSYPHKLSSCPHKHAEASDHHRDHLGHGGFLPSLPQLSVAGSTGRVLHYCCSVRATHAVELRKARWKSAFHIHTTCADLCTTYSRDAAAAVQSHLSDCGVCLPPRTAPRHCPLHKIHTHICCNPVPNDHACTHGAVPRFPFRLKDIPSPSPPGGHTSKPPQGMMPGQRAPKVLWRQGPQGAPYSPLMQQGPCPNPLPGQNTTHSSTCHPHAAPAFLHM